MQKLKHKSVSEAAVRVVEKDLENIQTQIATYSTNQPDLVDFPKLKHVTHDNIKILSVEMKSLETEVRELKDLVSATFQLAVDQRYKACKNVFNDIDDNHNF